MNKSNLRLPERLLKVATPKELELYTNILRRQAALSTPLDYGLYVRDDLKPYPHTAFLNNIALALVEDRLYPSGPGPASVQLPDGSLVHPETGEPVLNGALFSMPPQHGKSTLLSGLLPAWHLTNFPDLPVIFVTHTGDYAEKYGAENRDYIETHPELGIKVAQGSSAKDYFAIDGHRGYMLSVSVGSNRVTGRKGKLIVMDDVIGSEEEAQSARFREKMLDYWYARLRTRRMRGTKFLYVGTRWVWGDFPGHIQATEPDKWFVVNLPALAFDTTDDQGFSVDPDTRKRDPLGRKPGDALCPELHSARELEEIRAGNPAWFTPLYQGRPTLAEGALFRDFSYYYLDDNGYRFNDQVVKEDECVRFGVADTALTTKTSSDYSVFMVVDLPPSGPMLIRHVQRERIQGDLVKGWVVEQAKKWNCSFVGIEDSLPAKATIQQIQREAEIVCRGLPTGNKDKWSRASSGPSEAINTGAILLPMFAPWKEEYENELRQFDKGEHDDQVDTTSHAYVVAKDLPRRRSSTGNQQRTTMDQRLARMAEKQTEKKVREVTIHPEIGLW